MSHLNSIAKRDLLAATRFSPETIRNHADEFFAEGRFGDAFEFFRKIDDRPGVQRVKQAVVELGDPEVLWRIEKAYPKEISKDDWARCGRNAMQAGKFHSAAYVFQRIGDAEGLAQAEKQFKPAEEASPSAQSPAAK